MMAMTLTLGACGGGDDVNSSYARLMSAAPQVITSVPDAQATLLTYTMPATAGGSTPATSLLFVPKGNAPVGGWPIVAWAHGTTTAGQATCAPSLTLDTLDGGLTAQGFPSHYSDFIESLVHAGYAVVAPDFEGLGAAENTPYRYYNSASEARSIIAAVVASRETDVPLSTRWAAVGHSEGGRGVLELQRFVGEAAALDFRGTVAIAPFTSVAASINGLSQMAASDPTNAALYTAIQNLFVGMLTVAVQVDSPNVDVSKLMGADLASQLTDLKTACVFAAFGQIGQLISTKTSAGYAGFNPQWSGVPEMQAYLAANDPAVAPYFRLTAPTLILQGTADVFVQPTLTSELVSRLQATTPPPPSLAYKTYPGKDHGTVMTVAAPDVIAFLSSRFQ
ncbi:hypothetical protein HR51_25965 [Burkholderia cepacia]|nr:hypothetical protein HR51_25965 [Burkholderia cepacia]